MSQDQAPANPGQPAEAPQDVDIDELEVEILILAKNPAPLQNAAGFLTRRGWPTNVMGNVTKAVEYIAANRPDFVLISVNHPHPTVNKLPDIIKVQDFRDGEYVDRELVLIKVTVDAKARAEVMQITDIFRAKIVDVQPKSLTIEITGNESKVEKFIHLMDQFGITELTRTGKAALPRK